MSAAERLTALGLTLPEVARPIGSYRPAVRLGDLVHTAGQLPLVDGRPVVTGKVGDTVTPEQAADAARTAALNAIAAVADLAGDIDRIDRIVKVVVYVAGVPEFTAQPAVANGASDLFAEVFGEDGVHARSAVGVAALPLDAPVEVEIIAQVR
jgi:enamine deaminase RidA (YjgF/YER057c/UK114 family)